MVKQRKKILGKPSDIMVLIRLVLGALIGFVYFLAVSKSIRMAYERAYYFRAGMAVAFAIVNCFIIVIIVLCVQHKVQVWSGQHKLWTVIIAIFCIVMLCIPFCVRKQGVLADDTSIQKKNLFGETVQEFSYNDIESVEVSVRFGIQYDITFCSGETLQLCSEELRGVKNFGCDQNLMDFDRTISQYVSKTVSSDTAWIKPSNIRRFFENEDVFEYFNAFFQKFYLK